MDILNIVLTYDNYSRPKEAHFSTSEISNGSSYQMYLASINTPKSVVQSIDNGINAKVGTGFHMFAEEALKAEKNPDILTEYKLMAKVCDKYNISGTSDVIYLYNDEWIIGDFKTKGGFQMKKTLKGGIKNEKLQLSIYAYLFWKQGDCKVMPTKGEIYAVHTGDQSWWSKADCEKLDLPLKSKVGKKATIYIDLMNADEVEHFICNRVDNMSSIVDCEDWQCGYCEFDCEYRDNIPKPEDQF